MPNPKSGTVTDDIFAGIKAVKAGRVEFKMDKGANVGVGIGKTLVHARPDSRETPPSSSRRSAKAKPASFKGRYILTMALSSTQSPGIRIAGNEYSKY